MNREQEQAIEQKIVRKLASMLMAAGYKLSVDDSEVLTKCLTLDKVIEAVFAVDEAWLICEKDGRKPQVYLVCGNGVDIITDYNTSLESIVRPVVDWAHSPAVVA